MRPALALAAALFVAPAASAAPPAASTPPPVPPKLFTAAGYAEPEIAASACKSVNAAETQCAVPAMTAGRYLVRAAATSTAQAPDAAQQITLVAGDQICTATRSPDVKTPWAVGAKRTFYSACLFTILTDTPITITALYVDAKATKDPGGPQLTVSRQPWGGVISGNPISVTQ
ncbi:MAG TPA: hypothetical protein VGI95_01920 [Caulobacteraceae bacterium]|jgi:hypothetical protein